MVKQLVRLKLLIFLTLNLFSCGNNQHIAQTEDETVEKYMVANAVEAYYLDYGDTARWNREPMSGSLHMKNPIIKINLNKSNDIKRIYEQFDSAIAFANMIGFDNAMFSATISSFDTPQYSEYEEEVEGYLDTAKWLNKADAYLRDHRFTGINTHAFPIASFVFFETEIEHNQFIEKLMNDSIAYLVFSISRIWESKDPKDCPNCNEHYPTYGGKKIKKSYWKERQTKPYPRRP